MASKRGQKFFLSPASLDLRDHAKHPPETPQFPRYMADGKRSPDSADRLSIPQATKHAYEILMHRLCLLDAPGSKVS
jgi:hypothetical protein